MHPTEVAGGWSACCENLMEDLNSDPQKPGERQADTSVLVCNPCTPVGRCQAETGESRSSQPVACGTGQQTAKSPWLRQHGAGVWHPRMSSYFGTMNENQICYVDEGNSDFSVSIREEQSFSKKQPKNDWFKFMSCLADYSCSPLAPRSCEARALCKWMGVAEFQSDLFIDTGLWKSGLLPMS